MSYQQDFHLFLMNNFQASTRRCTDKATQLLTLAQFELEAKNKQIAELEEAILVHIGMSHEYLSKETVEGFVYYWTTDKYTQPENKTHDSN